MAIMPTVEFVEDGHDGYYVVAGATFRSLTAAARAVVEAWEALTYELPGTIDDPIVARMDALRAAVEAADH